MLTQLKAARSIVRHLLNHPVGRRRPAGAIADWLRWQLGTRLLPGGAVVPFVGETVLVASRGMTGATGNIYSGLHEFDDMGFLLHFLRPGEAFDDIGANIGSYSVLAAGVCGAQGFAVEPIESTAQHLERNLAINGLGERMTVVRACVGAEEGTALMTTDRDTSNRVVTAEGPNTVEVPVTTIDALCAEEVPVLLKIDVEGFEAAALAGGKQTLSDRRLRALIIEITGDDAHHAAIAATLSEAGLRPVSYDPTSRALQPLEVLDPTRANTIFVRDLETARKRVRTAAPFTVKGLSF